MTQTMKAQKHIQAATIFRCYAKEDTLKQQCIGYGVPSDTEGTYYVTYNYMLHRYECTCKDHINRQHNCKHINAVIEVAAIRNESKQQVATPAATIPVVEVMEAAHEAMVQFDRDADPNAYGVLAETKVLLSQHVYGTCGHLAKRADRSCGCDA